MPAAMTSKGVIAGRHQNVVLLNGSCWCPKATQENQDNETQGPLSTSSTAEASCRGVPLIAICVAGRIFGLAPSNFRFAHRARLVLHGKMLQSAQLGALPTMAAPEKAMGPFHSGTRNPRFG